MPETLREKIGNAARQQMISALRWSGEKHEQAWERFHGPRPIPADRAGFFRGRIGRRYWWHQEKTHDYVPALYGFLREDEWEILAAWFDETDRKELIGESSVPFMSVLQGFVMGSAISGVVQCGHYAGYSSLLMGFMFRAMGKPRSLFSIDIDSAMCDYTRGWIERAGLTDYVTIQCGDSADPAMPERATQVLGKPISAVLIDSSHQYAHTLRELDLWYEAIPQNGLLFLHDTSDFATSFDSTQKGGVATAFKEWAEQRKVQVFSLNAKSGPVSGLTYKDGCGIGFIQKPG